MIGFRSFFTVSCARQSVLCGCCLLSVVMAYAEPSQAIKPGLWEVTVKANVNGQELPDMQKLLEQVPPEFRDQLKAKMAQQGTSMTDNGAVRTCLTQEQIARNQFGTDPKGRCKTTDVQKQGNTLSLKIVCDKPKGKGETVMTVHSSEAWESKTHMTIEKKGDSQEITSEMEGKWVSADCGTVKPSGQSVSP